MRQSWQLEHCDITIMEKMGVGTFGVVSATATHTRHASRLQVCQGTLQRQRATVNVAIKMARLDLLTKEHIKEFLREVRTRDACGHSRVAVLQARLLRDFDHPHIVRAYGVAAQWDPLMIVVELVRESRNA